MILLINKNTEINFYCLISNFRRVLNVLCFLLGDSPTAEFYMPTFRNTLSPSFLMAQAISEPNLFPYNTQARIYARAHGARAQGGKFSGAAY